MKVISVLLLVLTSTILYAQEHSGTIELKDITWDKEHPAFFRELVITSEGDRLQGFINGANGAGPHPTLILLHGFPGNERNLDLAQVVRAHGWNTVYFNYRGSWGSDGVFSFSNNVEDVENVVRYLKDNAEELRVDANNIVLFGHSMGGWVCLKAIQQIPEVTKGFALSTWDISAIVRMAEAPSKELFLKQVENYFGDGYIVLNTTMQDLFSDVYDDPTYFDLAADAQNLRSKSLVMIDEHPNNQRIEEAISDAGGSVKYEVWPTDHSFTNKRVSLMNRLLTFLEKD